MVTTSLLFSAPFRSLAFMLHVVFHKEHTEFFSFYHLSDKDCWPVLKLFNITVDSLSSLHLIFSRNSMPFHPELPLSARRMWVQNTNSVLKVSFSACGKYFIGARDTPRTNSHIPTNSQEPGTFFLFFFWPTWHLHAGYQRPNGLAPKALGPR